MPMYMIVLDRGLLCSGAGLQYKDAMKAISEVSIVTRHNRLNVDILHDGRG